MLFVFFECCVAGTEALLGAFHFIVSAVGAENVVRVPPDSCSADEFGGFSFAAAAFVA